MKRQISLFYSILFLLIACGGRIIAQSGATTMPTSPTGYSNSTSWDGMAYWFYFAGSPKFVFFPNQSGTFHYLFAYDNNSNVFLPSNYGGPLIWFNGTLKYPWESGVSYRLDNHQVLANDTVLVEYTMSYGNVYYGYSYKFKISGNTLIIKVQASPYNNPYSTKAYGFELDRCDLATNAKVIRVPYLTQFNILYSNSSAGGSNGVFTSMFFDWETTNASTLYPNQVSDVIINGVNQTNSKRFTQLNRYNPKTDTYQTTNPLKETIYLTVASDINNVLPNLVGPSANNGVASNKDSAASRTVFCYWPPYTWILTPDRYHYNIYALQHNDPENRYVGEPYTTALSYADVKYSVSPYLDKYKIFHLLNRLGVKRLNVIVKNYQYYGFDRKLPNVLVSGTPAPTGFLIDNCDTVQDVAKNNGGITYISTLKATLWNNFRYKFGLHEQYVDTYWETPGYSTNNIAKNPDGTEKKSWNTKCSNVLPDGFARVIKPTIAGTWAQNWSTQLANFAPTFSYLDVHSAANPSDDVDYENGIEGVGLFRTVLQKYRSIPGILQSSYGSSVPIQGEGGPGSMLYVGYFDDLEARLHTADNSLYGLKAPLFVDFALTKMHPKSALHGVGHYNMFYGVPSNDYAYGQMTHEETLTYIATELAYGHSGLITKGDEVDHCIEQAVIEKEHVYPVQLLLSKYTPSSITYYRNGVVIGSASEYTQIDGWDNYDDPSSNFMSQVKVVYATTGIRVYVNRNRNSTWDISTEIAGLSGKFFYNLSSGLGVTTTRPTSAILASKNGWLVYVPDYYCYQLQKGQYSEEAESKILNNELPTDFALQNNYPNPFNPETTIKFELPENSNVKIIMYDILGRSVATLFNGMKEGGYHSVQWNASKYSSGVYICRMEASGVSGKWFSKEIKMMLTK